MDELEIINIIKSKSESEYIGDDCAYLKELGIVISQDNLVEDVHFKREWYTPRELGYKCAAVNISDILASGAKPAYLTVALSLPNNISNSFIEDFYHAEDGSQKSQKRRKSRHYAGYRNVAVNFFSHFFCIHFGDFLRFGE